MVEIDYIIAGICFVLSFVVSLALTKVWIHKAKQIGLVGKDMNKWNGKDIPEAGGIAVIFGLVFGLLIYIFFKVFYLKAPTSLLLIFVTICSVLLACFIGFIDDILGWKKGLKQWQKPLLTIPIAIPLMVINAGHSTISIPIFGVIQLGIYYPLLLIPILIVGFSNGFNTLGGFNGFEAGMGAIMISVLGIIAWFNQVPWVSLISFCAVASLLGFLMLNKYPSKIFPGDSLTYSIGSLIAILAILGDMEKVAIILFIPYFVELLFNLKSRFKKECFGEPQENGYLKPPQKVSSITHVFMKFFNTEKRLVYAFWIMEIMIGGVILSSLFLG